MLFSFKKALVGSALVFLISGCAHQVTLASRKNGERGVATVTTTGNKSGEIEISLRGKIYRGTWVYMLQGGGVGFSNMTMVSGTRVATGSGNFIAMPMGGPGNMIASTEDGSTIRCSFQFSEWGRNGIGVCEDNKGEVYDLQIR